MGLILDIVPNHMGIADRANAWWIDVLENGPSSLYAALFDIDWHPVKPDLAEQGAAAGPRRPVRPRARAASCRSTLRGRRFPLCYYEHTLPDRAARYGARSCEPASTTLVEPRSATTTRAAVELPEHPDGPRVPAAATETGPERVRRAAPREGGHQAAARRARRGIATGRASASTRHVACLQRHARRAAQLRPARRLLDEQAYRLALLARRRRGDQLPALLRHQRAGGDPHGERRRSSRPPTSWSSGSLAEGKVTGLRIDHPTACATRARIPAAAASASCLASARRAGRRRARPPTA